MSYETYDDDRDHELHQSALADSNQNLSDIAKQAMTDKTALGEWLDDVAHTPNRDGSWSMEPDKVQLIQALRAVDEMHSPNGRGYQIKAREGLCKCEFSYPCPTRTAIEKALGV